MNDQEMLDGFEAFLPTVGAQNMLLVVYDQEIDIMTAIENNLDDMITAYSSPFRFDDSYRNDLSNNTNVFFYIPMDDMWGFSVPESNFVDKSLKIRRFFTSAIISNKLSNLSKRLFNIIQYFYD